MANARDLLGSGDPRGALDLLKQEIRKAPREATLRTFLFQLSCVFGEWDRALTQLKLAGELDPLALPMTQTYQTLIRCELIREGVFAGTRTPTIFGQPLPWLPLLIEANRALAGGKLAAAADLRDQAFDQAEPVPGTADGTPFDWIADADPRLGPVLEAVLDGTYYWIPIQHVAAVGIDAPVDLRDQIWTPARFTWTNGGQAIGFMPARYPGSQAADPQLAMGRRTEFTEPGGPDSGWAIPLGQRMFTTGDADLPLLDLRELSLGHAQEDAEATEPEPEPEPA